MDDIPFALINLIDKAADQLDRAGLERSLVQRVKDLAEEVRRPCTVAVVGKIKAGKSTFVNALLGKKLAKVGVVETTATLNYFRYGKPNLDDTVRCYWKNKKGVTNESRQFLDSLQGHDKETLKRSEEIDHLEYYVPNPLLEEMTLIDTPGMRGPKEHHELAIDSLDVERLRESHDLATRDAHSKADAVIYLLDTFVSSEDEILLEEFRQRTQGQKRAMNAIGVIARIDKSQDLVQRRAEQATLMAKRHQKSLNTVLAVSASLEQMLDQLERQSELERQIESLAAAIRHIPENNLNFLLKNRNIFDNNLNKSASASSPEEQQLLRNFAKTVEWGVFVTFARQAGKADLSSQELLAELRDIAGFARLRKLLFKRFLEYGQGRWLRCFHIVRQLREILREVRYDYRLTFFDEEAKRKKQRERFLDYLKCLKDPHARALEMFVREQLAPHLDPERIVNGIERELGEIEEMLELHNGDIVALQWIEDRPDLFGREDEEEELRKLFGYYTRDINERLQDTDRDRKYVRDRKKYWTQKNLRSNDLIVCEVATQAARRYTQFDRVFPNQS